MSFPAQSELASGFTRRRGACKRPAARRLRLEALEDRTVLSISPADAYPVGTSAQTLATADFNGDNRPDLAVAVSTGSGSNVSILLGNSDGTFQPPITSPADPSFAIQSMAAGDLDRDGTMDLVAVSLGGVFHENGNLILLFGNGDGTFQAPVNSSFYGPLSIAMGDLDGDNDLDVVMTIKVYTGNEPTFKSRLYDDYVAVLRNDLDWTNHFAHLVFTSAYFLNGGAASRQPDAITIADINGHPSVAFTTVATNKVNVMLGNGSMNLGSPLSGSTGTAPRSVAVGDVNGDGIADLVSANYGSNNISVHLGTGGSPLFQSAVTYAAGTNPISVALTDLNADGRLDAVVANAGSDDVSLLMNLGSGVFDNAVSIAAGAGPARVAVASFNGDVSPSDKPYYDLAVADSTGNAVSVLLNGADWVTTSTVAGRHIFYNQSLWDANTAAINFFADNAARAPDKTAYLPGDPKAVAYNITNYTRGINGIMVDLTASSALHKSITASDFVFKVGNNNTPASWAAAPAPASVAVSIGGGVGGSDRVEITWPTGSIMNKWLEVQVLPNSRTGLTAPDVFFWGNKAGDSASGTLDNNNFVTNSTDAAQVFATLTAVNAATIDNPRDFNRDKNVNSSDAAFVFALLGNLNRLLVGAAGPFAPEGGGGSIGGGDAGISSALAGGGGASGSIAQALPTAHLPTAIRDPLEGGGVVTSATIDAALASSPAGFTAADDDADGLDELYDSLLPTFERNPTAWFSPTRRPDENSSDRPVARGGCE